MKGLRLKVVVVIVLSIATETHKKVSTIKRKTRQGIIEGRKQQMPTGAYESYTSIPYARPPIGRLRFQPPEPLDEPWDSSSVLDATQYPPVCPQLTNNEVIGVEDCLYLNIFVPRIKKTNDAGLPVMVFIHGGAFVSGGSNPGEYGPQHLISHGVILVTINYRLGALGFLSTETPSTPGNQGVCDIILALNWISGNIVDYGGDAGKVTVFGQSAGSMAISALLVIPAPFQRAILQSGTLVRPYFLQGLRDNRTHYAVELGNALGCSQGTEQDLMKCLQQKSAADIVSSSAMFSYHTAWQPVVDRYLGDEALLPLDPLAAIEAGNARDIDIIIGSNDGDGWAQLGRTVYSHPNRYNSLQHNFSTNGPLLILGRKKPSTADVLLSEKIRFFYLNQTKFSPQTDKEMMTLMTDNMYQAGGRRILDVLAEEGRKNLYQYMFTYIGSVTNSELWFNMSRPELGACHGDEIHYLFSRDGESPLKTPTDVRVSNTMVKFWTNFAKTGNPNTHEISTLQNTHENGFHIWTQITKQRRDYLNIGSSLIMELPDSYKQRIHFWESIFEDSVMKPGMQDRNMVGIKLSHGIRIGELMITVVLSFLGQWCLCSYLVTSLVL